MEKLFAAMEKKMGQVVSFREDLEVDKKTLLENGTTFTEYLWFTRTSGTILVPASVALIKGSSANILLEFFGESSRIHPYRITLSQEEGKLDGKLEAYPKVWDWVKENAYHPDEVYCKAVLKDGREEEVLVPYVSKLFPALVQALGCEEEDIKKWWMLGIKVDEKLTA